jgi:hypothetical protein
MIELAFGEVGSLEPRLRAKDIALALGLRYTTVTYNLRLYRSRGGVLMPTKKSGPKHPKSKFTPELKEYLLSNATLKAW